LPTVAPEVLARHHSKEADVWSAGVILYMLLCGEAPFQGPTEDETFDRIANLPIVLEGGPWDAISGELCQGCLATFISPMDGCPCMRSLP
jgi:calcium-dependent protein kinase